MTMQRLNRMIPGTPRYFYQKLLARRVIASMRKLLVTLNAMLKHLGKVAPISIGNTGTRHHIPINQPHQG